MAFPAFADIIDRVAVAVGNQVITLSQVIEEIRVAAFLNGEQPDMGAASRRKTADRLVEQVLIQREMDFNRYQTPTLDDIAGMLKQAKARFPSEAAYQQALQDAGITESELRQHLLLQITTLRFIDYRFLPGVQITAAEIRDYYDAHRQELAVNGRTPPIANVRDDIEKLLKEQRVDQALDRWLGEARTQAQITYHQEAFQ